MYILIFMFIFTIDDKHHNSFYYKCLNVIYRPPSYCVAIIMTTLLMSSTGLCNMSLSVIIRYCRVRWTGLSVLGSPRLVLQCGKSTFVDRAYLTRLPSKQELRWLQTRKPLAYRESTCTNLSVSCPYEIIVYSVLKHINTARMHTISRQFIPLIYCSLGKRILSKIQPILPFH